jgi:hypothetical protein
MNTMSAGEEADCSINEDYDDTAWKTQARWTRGTGSSEWYNNDQWYTASVKFQVADDVESDLLLSSGAAGWLRIGFQVDADKYRDKVFFDVIVVKAH